MASSEELLELARREIGTKEKPAGSNCVKYNTAYYGWEVSGDAYPWCCVFLWWLFQSCSAAELFYGGARTASCGALMTGVKLTIPKEPRLEMVKLAPESLSGLMEPP